MPNDLELSKSPVLCFRCGECCAKYQVLLNFDEAQCIASEFGISFEVFVDKYIDHRWNSADSLLVDQRDGLCVFLERNKITSKTTCIIQRVKPVICRQWTAGVSRRECREGLAKYWGITVNRDGLLEGTEERLRDLSSFVESLI